MGRHSLSLLILLVVLGAAGGETELPLGVQEVTGSFRGQLYFAAKNLTTGEILEHRAGQRVQAASVIKLPILVEVFAQAKEHRLTLSDGINYSAENRVQGSGILQDLGTGLRFTIRDLAVLMTVLSDNTATNLLIDKVGIASVSARMRHYGLKDTVLFRKVFKPAPEPVPQEQAKWGLGVTTPRDMLLLMEKIYRKEVVDPASCDAMIAILKKQRDRDQIPRYFAGPGWEKVEVAHKTGALDRVRNDVALVFAPQGVFVLSLFAQESEDRRWTPDNEATLALARLARALMQHFGTAAPR